MWHFCLDFLWKLLVVVSFSSTLLFGAFLVAQGVFRNFSGMYLKKCSQIAVCMFLSIILLSTLALLTWNPAMQLECFQHFVTEQGALGVTRVLALIWILVTAGRVFLDLWQYRRHLKFIKGSTIATGESYLVGGNSLMPLTFGFMRPEVIIPQWITTDSKQLQHILGHEQTHARNHDSLWSLVFLMCARIAWFNPVAWVFQRNQQLVFEMATDEQVLRDFNFDAKEYCDSLLKLLDHQAETSSPLISQGASGEFKQMRARLLNLQKAPGESSWGRRLLKIWLVAAWMFGMNQAWASIQVDRSIDTDELMCSQIQHELVIEKLLKVNTENNKCE